MPNPQTPDVEAAFSRFSDLQRAVSGGLNLALVKDEMLQLLRTINAGIPTWERRDVWEHVGEWSIGGFTDTQQRFGWDAADVWRQFMQEYTQIRDFG